MSVRITVGSNYLLLQSDSDSLTDDEAKNCVATLRSRPERLPAVVFDFSRIKVVSLTALRTLTLALSVIGQRNTHLAVIASPEVRKFISEQVMDRFFPCYNSLGDALHQLLGEESRQKTQIFLAATLEAVSFTLQTTTNTQVIAGPQTDRSSTSLENVEIGAVVSLICLPFTGSLILGFHKDTYLALMARLFGQEFTEITLDIQDGAAEFLNIILGHVKTTVNEKGFGLKQAIPSVVQGLNLQILPAANQNSIVIPYTSELGKFYVELATTPQATSNPVL